MLIWHLESQENKAATNAEEKKQLFPRPPHYKQAKKSTCNFPRSTNSPSLSLGKREEERDPASSSSSSPLSLLQAATHSADAPGRRGGKEKVTTFYS